TACANSTSCFVNGNLRKPISTGASTPQFEVGTGSTYAPINLSITGASAGGTLTASSTAGQHPSFATSGLSLQKYVNRYWTLTPGGGLTVTSYNAAFTFANPGDLVGSPNTAALAVRKFTSPSTWTAPSSSSSTSTTASGNGFTTFGDFAAGQVASA